MKLFKLFKRKKEEKEIINPFPIVLKTEDVNISLLEIAKTYNFSLAALDFSILSYKTLVKVDNEDFVEVEKEHLNTILKDDFLRDEKNIIKQVYEIRVKRYEENDYLDLVGKVEVDKNYIYAKYHIMPNSKIIYSPLIENLFIEEINKKKLKNGLLIGIFDEEMLDDINRVLAKVRIMGEIEESEVINLCKGLAPVNKVDAKIILHYKKRKESVKKELVYPVKKGDILIEIIKPKNGKNGRGCNGKIIKVPPAKELRSIDIDFNPHHIKREEDVNKIVYIANKNGYLYKENDKYFINDNLSVNVVNIKTGDIIDGDEADIKLEINEKSALKEAVGDGMIVESTIVKVKGNVGNGAKITAKSLEIKGQTHKNSKLFSDIAKLNIHRGYIEGKKVEVNILENGKIVADEVIVNQAVGGEIIAKSILINIVGSHLSCSALNEIIIKKIIGSENKFKISTEIIEKKHSLSEIEKELKELKISKERILREYKKRVEVLNKNKNAYEEMKNRYLKEKEKGIKPPISLIKKIKEYQEYKDNTLKLKEKILKIDEDIKVLEEELNYSQNYLFNAKILSYTKWTPFNRIEFDLVNPPVKIKYDTKGDEGVCGFMLRDLGEGDFKIVKIRIENDSSS